MCGREAILHVKMSAVSIVKPRAGLCKVWLLWGFSPKNRNYLSELQKWLMSGINCPWRTTEDDGWIALVNTTILYSLTVSVTDSFFYFYFFAFCSMGLIWLQPKALSCCLTQIRVVSLQCVIQLNMLLIHRPLEVWMVTVHGFNCPVCHYYPKNNHYNFKVNRSI